MRIGIDCLTMLDAQRGEYAGVAHYTYYLVRSLIAQSPDDTFVLFVYDKQLDMSEFKLPNVEIVIVPLMQYKKFLPLIYRHCIVPLFFKKARVDLMHFPAPIRPLCYWGKTVTTIHDLVIYRNPRWFMRLSWFFTRVVVPASIRRADAVIAVSEATKQEIIDFFTIPPERVNVVHEGVNDLTIGEAVAPDGVEWNFPYFFFVGTIEPRKNIVRLIKGFMEFVRMHPDTDMKLVIAGKLGWKFHNVVSLLEDPAVAQRVLYVGYVSQAEKAFLYRHAFALTYPSLFEGFGLQLLEAMHAGVPLITSNEGAISEIVLDNAIIVDPYKVMSIAHGMRALYLNPTKREAMIVKGRGIASAFSWKSAAVGTLEVYRAVMRID